MESDVKPGELFEGLHGISLGLILCTSAQQIIQVRRHQIEQQALFIGRIIIERADLHPDLSRNLTHGDGRIAVLREQGLRGLADARGRQGGMGTCGACHASL